MGWACGLGHGTLRHKAAPAASAAGNLIHREGNTIADQCCRTACRGCLTYGCVRACAA
ncbi:hypothetical protein RR42_m4169 [Cupriavidus basilensis]|uniref:Uncharacterized protein n=1 Tax=Cupriavidus basilensis TaxID=68895 RepID=A0A0C4YLM4_9BURK|nr:hypothetical protein RR42_m4169 [Cupriavidus basilensis]